MSRRPSPSLAISLVALFVALGGTGYALTITGRSVKDRSLTRADIKRNTLTGTEIRESRLARVPRAARADTADTAARAGLADRATAADRAGTADTAASAGNAGTLDSIDSSGFLKVGQRGLAVAYARVATNGNVLDSFSESGGSPTTAHTPPGFYEITFPGISVNVNTRPVAATLVGEDGGEIMIDSAGGKLRVRTRDSAGTLADRQFTVILYPPISGD